MVNRVDELAELLRPSWGAEKWILEGWNKITADEKQIIKNRLDELFCDGLPFELKSDKLLYIYAFSLLAQLEVLAIQIPLKFESKMSTVAYRQRMRQQLLDEVFHGLVFTKIVYMLCSPLATPPPYNPNIEILCNFIRNENCPKTAIMLLNLIGEGWIEEIFYSLHRCNIAPKVFSIILEDEHRHVSEADLYRDIGMPDISDIEPKIAFLEEQLITSVFMQHNYMFSISRLLGVEGAADFKHELHKKHVQQLKKINLKPTKNWTFFMKFGNKLLPKVQENIEIDMSSTRKFLMTQWDNPRDPKMTGQFNLNVSCLDLFNKKFPSETLTCLMLQAASLQLTLTESSRQYLSFRKIYQSLDAHVGLIVKLPGCGDQIGAIVFKNCHEFSMQELSAKIQSTIGMMVYCYKKREYLEKNSLYLQEVMKDMIAHNPYGSPISGTPFVSVSNIGSCGYSQVMSPLLSNEPMKLTLLEVERRLVWNKDTQTFEPQDMLPVSLSADHRLFDGNLPVPKMLGESFNVMFSKMIQELPTKAKPRDSSQHEHVKKLLDQLIETNLELGYKTLLLLQTCWSDFVPIDELSQQIELVEASADF